MINSLFTRKKLRQRHQCAPLLNQRERYLSYLLRIGITPKRVRDAANTLLNLIQVLELNELRPVRLEEITSAISSLGKQNGAVQNSRELAVRNPVAFRRFAIGWLRFTNALVIERDPVPPFQELLQHYLETMRDERGFAPATLKVYGLHIYRFLRWYSNRSTDFANLTLLDIDEFLDLMVSAGWKPISIQAFCTVLRAFVGFAELRGWCRVGLQRGIHGPRVLTRGAERKGPPWKDVRRLIESTAGERPIDYKARAIILLCAIYGFRASEVARLTLDDLDWRQETITARRSKRGRVQQFPLQYEVGEAIIQWLRHGRPDCTSRNLFLTSRPPYRPATASSLYDMVSKRMRKLGIGPGLIGPHALRHSCATQLLKKGLSLQEIADFLGHHGTRTVSHYVKHDPRSLKEVANFSLRGVI